MKIQEVVGEIASGSENRILIDFWIVIKNDKIIKFKLSSSAFVREQLRLRVAAVRTKVCEAEIQVASWAISARQPVGAILGFFRDNVASKMPLYAQLIASISPNPARIKPNERPA